MDSAQSLGKRALLAGLLVAVVLVLLGTGLAGCLAALLVAGAVLFRVPLLLPPVLAATLLFAVVTFDIERGKTMALLLFLLMPIWWVYRQDSAPSSLRADSDQRDPWWLWWIVGAGMAGLATHAFLPYASSTNGLIYDWNVSLTDPLESAREALHIWTSLGLGGVSAYKTLILPDLLVGVLGGLTGSVWFAQACMLFGSFALAAAGQATFLRLLGASRNRAVLGAFLFTLTPFLTIRVASGYTGVLFAMAALPWLFSAAYRYVYRDAGLQALAAILLLAPFAGAQPQLLALLTVAGGIACLASSGQARKRYLQVVTTGLLGWSLVNVAWVLAVPPSTGALASQGAESAVSFLSRIASLPIIPWVAGLGASHPNTDGYVAQLGWYFLAASVVVSTAAHAALRSLGRRTGILVAGVLVVASLISTGLQLPGAVLYDFLYRNLPGMAIFREPAHIQVVLVVAIACLVPLLRVRRMGMTFIALAVVVAWLPFRAGTALGITGRAAVPEKLAEQRAFIEKLPSRIAFPPGLGFWKYPSDQRLGAQYPDQWARSVAPRSLPQASSDLESRSGMTQLRTYAMHAIQRGDTAATQQRLEVLGVGYLGFRQSVQALIPQAFNLGQSPRATYWSHDATAQAVRSYVQVAQIGDMAIHQVSARVGDFRLVPALKGYCDLSELEYDAASLLVTGPDRGCSNSQRAWLAQQQGTSVEVVPQELTHDPALGIAPGSLALVHSEALASYPYASYVTTSATTQQGSFRLPANCQQITVEYLTQGNGQVRVGLRALPKTDGGWGIVTSDAAGEFSLQGDLAAIGLVACGSPELGSLATTESFSQEGVVAGSEHDPKHFTVTKASRDRLLVLATAYHPGWVAQVDAQHVETLAVDGWALAVRVPADAQGSLRITFAPQNRYQLLLTLGLSLWLLLAVSGYVASWRQRRAHATS